MENVLWGFVGVFVGTMLTVISQFLIARMQLKHQSDESNRNRVIEARKLDLFPLRNSLAEWVLYEKKVLGHYVSLKESESAKQDPVFLAKLTADFKEVFHKEGEAMDRLDIAMNHISDHELIIRIRQLQDYKIEQIGPIYRTILKTIDSSAPSTNKLSVIPMEYHPIRNKMDELLVSINARIEQLLCGDQNK